MGNKNVLIMVEGAPATMKSTITTLLRERITCSNLLRQSGLPKATDTAMNAFLAHSSVLSMLEDRFKLQCTYVFDRSFVSNLIYSRLGFKNYDFEQETVELLNRVKWLTTHYDVYYITLTATKDDFEQRLQRDKSEYIAYSVENSMQQQAEFVNFHNQIKSVNYMNCIMIDTHDRTSDSIANEIIGIITNGK